MDTTRTKKPFIHPALYTATVLTCLLLSYVLDITALGVLGVVVLLISDLDAAEPRILPPRIRAIFPAAFLILESVLLILSWSKETWDSTSDAYFTMGLRATAVLLSVVVLVRLRSEVRTSRAESTAEKEPSV